MRIKNVGDPSKETRIVRLWAMAASILSVIATNGLYSVDLVPPLAVLSRSKRRLDSNIGRLPSVGT